VNDDDLPLRSTASTVTESPSPTLPYSPQRWESSTSPASSSSSAGTVVAADVSHLDRVVANVTVNSASTSVLTHLTY